MDRASDAFGWCFIGAGSIARRVLNDFDKTGGAYLASVYSRTSPRAEKLAADYGARAYDTPEAAMRAPGVRGVYVATPHPAHAHYAKMALAAGIPVVCEKPLATNLADAEAMVACSRANNTFFMEGMWMRFNPAVNRALSWVADGRIGRVRTLTASFASRCAYDASSRLFSAELGGGALLDVGIYALAIARFVMGKNPSELAAMADFAPTGVDSQSAMILKYDDGAIARLFSGLSAYEPQDAYIYGEGGYIHLPKFWAPKAARLIVDGDEEVYNADFEGEGFQFEFRAAMADIEAGRIENGAMPHSLSLQIMKTAQDAIGRF